MTNRSPELSVLLSGRGRSTSRGISPANRSLRTADSEAEGAGLTVIHHAHKGSNIVNVMYIARLWPSWPGGHWERRARRWKGPVPRAQPSLYVRRAVRAGGPVRQLCNTGPESQPEDGCRLGYGLFEQAWTAPAKFCLFGSGLKCAVFSLMRRESQCRLHLIASCQPLVSIQYGFCA